MHNTGKLALVYCALLLLLASTVACSFFDLHGFNTAANLSIAAIKATLVGVFFMKLSNDETLPRLVVAAVGLWLSILVGLTIIS